MAELNLEGHYLKGHPKTEAALKEIHAEIETLNERLIIHYSGNDNFYATDFLFFAAAKRTLSVGRAFLTMMAVPNFGVAAALLRMQLDTALRFSAMQIAPSQSKFASEVLGGARIDKMKSKTGQRLTDKYLVDRLTKDFPGIEKIYEETSGFVHLSGKHMFQTFSELNDTDHTFKFVVSAEDVPRPAVDYVEILKAFLAVTRLVIAMLVGFASTRPKAKPATNQKTDE